MDHRSTSFGAQFNNFWRTSAAPEAVTGADYREVSGWKSRAAEGVGMGLVKRGTPPVEMLTALRMGDAGQSSGLSQEVF